MKGICYYCNKELTERTIKRHMKTCSEIEKVIEEKKTECHIVRNQYVLSIKPKYDKDKYCMYLSIDGDLSLKHIDKFIRDIWVECCNHLSMFKISGCIFHQDDMAVTINEIISEGSKMEYIYDFGSSTELELEVVEIKQVPVSYSQIQIIARNCEGGSPRHGVCGYVEDKVAENKYLPGNTTKYHGCKQKKSPDLESEEEYFGALSDDIRNIMENMAEIFESLAVKEFSLDIQKILNSLTKDDVYFMARRLGMKKISGLNKEKLIEKMMSEYEELIKEKMLLLDDKRYRFLKKYVDNNGIVSLDDINMGIEEILYFRNLGMIFYSLKNYDEVITYVPDVVRKVISEKNDFQYRNTIKNNTEIMNLYLGMNRAYGILKIDTILDLYKTYNVENENIEAIIDEGQYCYDYVLNKNYYINEDINSPFDLLEEIDKNEEDYAMIPRGELISLGKDEWVCETKGGKNFYDAFLEMFDVDRDELVNLMQSIYIDCQELHRDEILELALNMVADSGEVVKEMTKNILLDYLDSIRMWKYKGATKREVEGMNKPIKKEIVVGRNDPCPCGSGKKYKKCCGKNEKVIKLFQ